MARSCEKGLPFPFSFFLAQRDEKSRAKMAETTHRRYGFTNISFFKRAPYPASGTHGA